MNYEIPSVTQRIIDRCRDLAAHKGIASANTFCLLASLLEETAVKDVLLKAKVDVEAIKNHLDHEWQSAHTHPIGDTESNERPAQLRTDSETLFP